MITADEGVRGGKRIALKACVDGALAITGTECVKDVLVVRRTRRVGSHAGRARSLVRRARVSAADELSGRGNGRRGPAVHPLYLGLHGQAQGRAAHDRRLSGLCRVHARAVFDLREEDVYWATADIGWVTGHSYIVYGPLANGATTRHVRGRAELSRLSAASGRWSTSTRSPSSTPRPPRFAR